MSDWRDTPVTTPLESHEWADLLYDLERLEPGSAKQTAARRVLAERLARLENLAETVRNLHGIARQI